MAVIRKRLIFWLIKAYIKKSGKTLVLSFFVGLLAFFGIMYFSQHIAQLFPFSTKQSIGLVGAYTQDNLPKEVVSNLSIGLTTVSDDGSIEPGLAESWETTDSGKVYTFTLKDNQYFNNGERVTSGSINYDFSDVEVERPDEKTIIYKLQDAYAPFLVTVSRPVFASNYTGVGNYHIDDVELNGNFVQSLTLAEVENRQNTIHYEFYPTEEALKMAYLLGEVSEIRGLTAGTYDDTRFEDFPNTKVVISPNDERLVTLFYDTTDPVLSEKKLRLSLTYALPNEFSQGQRSRLPYSPRSIYYNSETLLRNQDINHAQLLLLPDESASDSAYNAPPKELTIKTLPKYKKVAEKVAEAWRQLDIKTTIEEVSEVPNEFQIFLGDFTLPRDPDQYTIWHSDQRNNITHYKNLRIDKLLEDGRKTTNEKDRIELYKDFQRYLLEDAPAAFLYFPTEYTIVRK